MPEMDGYEAARAIRSMGGAYGEIPIIALTAATFGEIRERILDAGINEYITKPFSPDELLEKIKVYADKSAPNNEVQEPAMPKNSPIKKHNIKLEPGRIERRIQTLTHNDKTFVIELSRLYISSLDELRTIYEQCLRNHDLNRLRDIRHKHKANIDMLELDDLAQKLESGKELLQKAFIDERELEDLGRYVHEYCSLVMAELQQILDAQ